MNFGFWSKMAVLWRISVFQNKGLKPLFYSVLGVSAFWAKVSKKGNFEKPPKKWKIWLIKLNWKAIFWYFRCFWGGLLFSCFFLFPLFFVFLLVFFWGFKGQVRWPEGPPHLALNPPCLFLLFLLFCFFCCVFFCCVFWFFNTKKNCFSPEKGIFSCQSFSFFLP